MSSGNLLMRKYTWRIENFSRLTERKYYSDVFTIGGCKWRLLVFPKGNTNSDHIAIYLDVPDFASLPTGWSISARFTLTMVNQLNDNLSTKKDTRHVFNVRESDWGFTSFKPLTDLQSRRNGFIFDDTLVLRTEVDVGEVVLPPVPPAADPTPTNVIQPVHSEAERFETFFSKLEEFIINTKSSTPKEGAGSSSTEDQSLVDLFYGSPSLEEVEKAKQSLKECLSDLFKLNMKDRLSAALSTLTRAEVGLSYDQQKSIKAFQENFEDFISDFLTFEQDNADFELQKLARDQMFSAMKKKHETHLANKQLLESLATEEEELKKRLEEVQSRKEKLLSDWGNLMTESEEAKTNYMGLEKKLVEAEEKKRIAEERMSRSTFAWSSLKAQFG